MAKFGSVSYSIDNVRGFEAQLAALGRKERLLVSKACERTASRVKLRARANVLPHKDRGDLLEAIISAGRGLRFRVGLRDGSVPSRGGRNTAHLNPWVYGTFLEHGTNNPFRPAHPFMRPAAEAEQPAHEQSIATALRETFA